MKNQYFFRSPVGILKLEDNGNALTGLYFVSDNDYIAPGARCVGLLPPAGQSLGAGVSAVRGGLVCPLPGLYCCF